ncbi:hypothetical protein AV530_005726 [Patagioenas fasciata monilis]|uniref:Uncharacterized protein n=1 Tax=Patagioenas fasciata monilis TaxID=372326 RepID=A0A1V4JMD4_PATFA|nr:hypothetical protein AV530_005726 [Patagioenas fasciata monilis]
MQMEGAGRGRRDSEPRKSGGTPYKNYWGPFPGRTVKAPETAAAPGSSERGGGRRGGASAPVGARRAAQAAALQARRERGPGVAVRSPSGAIQPGEAADAHHGRR